MSATATIVVDYDPTKDKTYRRARLAGDVVAWLEFMELSDASPATLDSYERVLARLCLLYPTLAVDEVTDEHLLQLAKRFKTPERRVRMAAVNSFFKWARATRRISDNPTDYLPKFRRPSPKVQDTFTDAEIETLLALPRIDAALMAILNDGGPRKAEARSLAKRDAIAENGAIIIRDGKGRKDRIVPMSSRMAALLVDLEEIEKVEGHEFLWYGVQANEVSRRVTRHQPIGEGTFHRWWGRCLEDAGVRYRNPHMARHTAATRWRRLGVPIDDIAAYLGHSSSAITEQTYVHTTFEERLARLRKLEAEAV